MFFNKTSALFVSSLFMYYNQIKQKELVGFGSSTDHIISIDHSVDQLFSFLFCK